jgi:CHAT domain-containing protein
MSTNAIGNNDLRRYLLGLLPEGAALRELEERLLDDADFQEETVRAESALIDEYVMGALPADEIAAFEGHFLAHPTRREQLRLARALRAYAQENAPQAQTAPAVAPAPKAGWFDWLLLPPVRAAACAVLLLAVGLGVWRIFLRQDHAAQRATAEIAAAFPQDGPLDVRVTGLALNPPPNTRGANDHKGDAEKLRRADYILLEAKPDPSVLHAKGKLALVQKSYDEAVKQLEAALQLDPDNAQLHADLGAALLAQAQSLTNEKDGNKLDFISRSLEHLSKALELNPNLLEASFNRALCLQKSLAWPNQAKEAWEDYLKKDADSVWATRARSYLKQLSEPISKVLTPEQVLNEFLYVFRQQDDENAWRILSQTREMISGRMVAFQLSRKYLAAATQDRQAEMSEALAALTYAGELEKKRGGDAFVADLAHYYAGQKEKPRLESLLSAQSELSEGYKLCLKSQYPDALSHFSRARESFAQAGDVWEKNIAEYWIGYVTGQDDQKIKESFTKTQAVLTFSQSQNYHWLSGQALYWLGNLHYLASNYSKSLGLAQQSLAKSRLISDTYNQQKALNNLSPLYSDLGRPHLALELASTLFAVSNESIPSPRQMWRNLVYTSPTFYKLRRFQAAAACEREVIKLQEIYEELRDPTVTYTTFATLGQIYGGMQDYPEALKNIELSRQAAHTMNSSTAGQRLGSAALVQLAHFERQAGDCPKALKDYDQAFQLNAQSGVELDRYEIHKGRFVCYQAANDSNRAQTELKLALEVFEQYRDKIREEQSRHTFFAAEHNIYDLAVGYEYLRQNYEQAFAYAEKSRARTLLDALQGEVVFESNSPVKEAAANSLAKPLPLAEIRAQLPAQAQIVHYAVLPEKLIIWVITRDNFVTVASDVSQTKLEKNVNAYLQAVQSPGKVSLGELNRQGRDLYEILIAPARQHLDLSQPVCFVPDKILCHVPFAALVTPENKYLVEQATLQLAPSASVFIICSQRARERHATCDEMLLAIGNPSFNRRAYDLPDLPAAAQEANAAAREYGRKAVLTNGQATKAAVTAQLGNADIIHFAGHYVADEVAPLQSRLLLAAGPNNAANAEDEDLTVAEIMLTKLPRAKLVVLSACQTGLDGYYAGEGMIGIARTFMVAGAPLVIASQWPVESEATAQLMSNFHSIRKAKGKNAFSSLRQAQQQILSETNRRFHHPYFWASFAAIGGLTEF